MKTLIPFSAILLLLSSCASFEDSFFSNNFSKSTTSLEDLSGTYQNAALFHEQIHKDRKSSQKDSLFCFWDHFNYKKYDFEKAKEYIVELKQLSRKKIELRLIAEDRLISKEKIRGKFEDGYFYERSKFFVLPLFPLVYGYANYRFRLTCDSEKNLIYEGIYKGHFITILGGTKSDLQTQSIHLRKTR